jgi:hypothetical protein
MAQDLLIQLGQHGAPTGQNQVGSEAPSDRFQAQQGSGEAKA